MIRWMKIILTAFVAAFCLLYALQNIVNLGQAYGFVAAMVSMEGHEAYPAHIGPAVQAPFLIWTMLWIIIIAELTAGALAARGAWDLFRARHDDSAQFHAAKRFAVLGAGLGVILWFGVFGAIGGAYFQMWQTELGVGPLRDASFFALQLGVVMLILLTPEE